MQNTSHSSNPSFYEDPRTGLLIASGMPQNDVLNALREVRRNLTFNEGFTSVKPEGLALKEYHAASHSVDVGVLCSNIRNLCAYDILSNGVMVHYNQDDEKFNMDKNEPEIKKFNNEARKHELIERTLNIIEASYGNAKREDGSLAITHLLQACQAVAAPLSPEKPSDRVSLINVASSGYHDIIEDVEDGSGQMKNVKFRVPYPSKETLELAKKQEIYHFIRGAYGGYCGGEINRVLRLVTRPPRPEGADKEDHYINVYLSKIWEDLRAPLIKWGDGNSNKETVWTINDPDMQKKKKMGVIYKLIPQIIGWKKLALVPAQIMLYDFRELTENTKYEGIEPLLRTPSKEDIENLERGYKVIGPRRYSLKLIADIPESGSPVLTYFHGGKLEEIEISFCDSPLKAEKIIKAGFGNDVMIRVEHKLIPYRLDRSKIFSLRGIGRQTVPEIERKLEKCVRAYDEMMSGGEFLEIFRNFNRIHRAQAARDMSGNIDLKPLEKFKFKEMRR